MIGVAKKLVSGKSIGIDIWRKEDMMGDSRSGALKNAEIEGVSGRIEIRNENIISTTFQDSYFDVVLSNLCIHNISSKDDREKAILEIARLLKPNGKAVITDISFVKDYAEIFSKTHMKVRIVKEKGTFFWAKTVIAEH
jgi:ubiquinone/menaquinone biosynthesis C-methylase UbiE